MQFDCSFDDARVEDLEVAEILQAFGISATFYVPLARTDWTEDDILRISRFHTIGSHTLTHPSDLKLLPDEELKFELVESKRELEAIIGKPVVKFAPPRGRYDERVITAIKAAGYISSRTTHVFNIKIPTDPFQTHTTIHMGYQRKEYEGVHWLELAKEYLDKAYKEPNGYWHGWAHGAELEKYSEWDNFETFLKLLREFLDNHPAVNII